MSGVAWDALLRLGLGDLGLPPDVFWSLTPVELMLMSGRNGPGAQLFDRQAMDSLMAQYPDIGEGHQDE